MNDDLISREALKNAILEHRNDYIQDNFFWSKLFDEIDNAPTITDHSKELVQKSIELGRKVGKLEGKLERPKGEWIKEVFHCVSYRCSECNVSYHVTMFANFNFCPNCGARMRGEEE